jgi:hypothetical protein
MDNSQTDFVLILSTHVNLIQVIRRIIRAKKEKGLEDDALFIQFSSA